MIGSSADQTADELGQIGERERRPRLTRANCLAKDPVVLTLQSRTAAPEGTQARRRPTARQARTRCDWRG